MTVAAFRDYLMEYVMTGTPGAAAHAFTAEDLAAIDHLRDTKYATWEWNFGHSPRYNFSKRARTPGGTVEATIEVTDGIIRAAHFYGDYFTRGDPAELAAALVGTPHREDALRERLNTLAVERYFVNVTAEDLTTVLL